MKRILISIGALALLATTGCLVAESGGHGHGRHGGHTEVIVPAPIIVVPVAPGHHH